MMRSLLVVLALASFAFAADAPAPEDPAPQGFFPFVIPWDDTTLGTATDVSFLNVKPAGVNGRIIARGGHFVEESTGNRVRFLGFNIGANSAYLPHEDADKLAVKLAKAGVNIVRLHHLDNCWSIQSGGSIWDPKRPDRQHLEPQQLERLDYLIAKLKEQGIYVNINLKVSRELTEADGMPPSIKQVPFVHQKRLDIFNRRWRELQKNYARDLLTHVNPYTQLAYTDDPAVAVVEINNENSLLGFWTRELGVGLDRLPEPFKGELVELWNQWLAGRYDSDAALATAWNEDLTPPGESIVTSRSKWTTESQGQSELAFTQSTLKPQERLAPDIEADVLKVDGTDWHVQAHLVELDLTEGSTYTVTFRARADTPRSMRVNVTKDRSDWHNMGLNAAVNVTPEWTAHTLSFKARDTVPGQARLAFILGNAAGKVFISDISLAPGAKGAGLQDGQSLAQKNIPMPPAGTPSDRQRADWIQFLADTERAYSDDMLDFLRHDLKVKANVALTQIDYGGLTGLNREQRMDLADAHAYWQHPSFLNNDWNPSNWTIANTPQVAEMSLTRFGELGNLAMVRVAGKPFSVSEYDHPAPSEYACEMMPTYATFAALQDWDIIYTFAMGDFGAQGRPSKIGGHFDQNNHPAKFAFYPSAAVIFRTGLIDPAPISATLHLPAPFHQAAHFADQAWRSIAGEVFDFTNRRLAISDQPLPAGEKPMAQFTGGDKATPRSQVSVTKNDAGNVYLADAPAAVAAAGFIGGQTIKAQQASLQFEPFGNNFAAFTLVAMDSQPLNQSKRILLTLAGRVENTAMVWNEKHNSINTNWGRGPTIAEGIRAQVRLTTAPGTARQVYALDGHGRRTADVPATLGDDGFLSFSIDPTHQTLWYEIAAE